MTSHLLNSGADSTQAQKRVDLTDVVTETADGRVVAVFLAAVANGDSADDQAAIKAIVKLWRGLMHEGGWRRPGPRGVALLRALAGELVGQIKAEPREAWDWFIGSSGDSIECEITDALEPDLLPLIQRA